MPAELPTDAHPDAPTPLAEDADHPTLGYLTRRQPPGTGTPPGEDPELAEGDGVAG
jgi:hypothetical protein